MIFNDLGNIYTIQWDLKNTLKEIIQKLIQKSNLQKEKIYFIYNGNVIKNEELTLEKTISTEDKQRNEMNILVYHCDDLNDMNSDNQRNMVKSYYYMSKMWRKSQNRF